MRAIAKLWNEASHFKDHAKIHICKHNIIHPLK